MKGPAALHAACRQSPELQGDSLVPRRDDPSLWRHFSPWAAEGSWENLSEVWIDST